jgi:hypothetical protein
LLLPDNFYCRSFDEMRNQANKPPGSSHRTRNAAEAVGILAT